VAVAKADKVIIRQLPTGVRGLDEILGGGLPEFSFNIITGVDSNGDGVFTERPAFATNPNAPGVIVTRFGTFDPNPGPGQSLIPRNLGTNPTFVNLNLRIAKTFKLGSPKGGQFGRAAEPFTLTPAIFVQNIFNRTNAGQRLGNLSSPGFGLPVSVFGTPRRIDFSLRFNF